MYKKVLIGQQEYFYVPGNPVPSEVVDQFDGSPLHKRIKQMVFANVETTLYTTSTVCLLKGTNHWYWGPTVRSIQVDPDRRKVISKCRDFNASLGGSFEGMILLLEGEFGKYAPFQEVIHLLPGDLLKLEHTFTWEELCLTSS